MPIFGKMEFNQDPYLESINSLDRDMDLNRAPLKHLKMNMNPT